MRRKPLRLLKPHESGIALFAAGILLASCATLEQPLGPIGEGDGQAAVRATQGGQPTDIDCPPVTIRTGASAWQLPSGASATNVRYQGAIGQLVRECAILGETMTMRVGVEGRLLVGPQGGPGTVSVPLRMALVQEGPQPRPIWSKFYSVRVDVPPSASQAVFSIVEDDLTFPLPADRRLDMYIVYVGFDPQGAAAPSRPAPKAKAKAAAPKAAPKAPTAAAPPPQQPVRQTTPQQPRFEPPPQQQQPAKSQPQFEPPPSPPAGVFAPPPK